MDVKDVQLSVRLYTGQNQYWNLSELDSDEELKVAREVFIQWSILETFSRPGTSFEGNQVVDASAPPSLMDEVSNTFSDPPTAPGIHYSYKTD